MQPEERGVCVEGSLPKERKSREQTHLFSVSLDKCCINECTYNIVVIAPPGGAELGGRGEKALLLEAIHVGVVEWWF